MPELKLAASILSCDFLDLKAQVKEAEDAGANMLHYDVMDGTFVPEISYGEPVLRSLRKGTKLFMDVHLMTVHPEGKVKSFQEAGADGITVHLETCENAHEVLKSIRDCGLKAGLSIKPDTSVSDLIPYLKEADMFLLMTVYPGFGGQKFLEASVNRIRELRELLDERGLEKDIQVDGGINQETILKARDAGANVFVAGSAVFKGNIRDNVLTLKERLLS